MVSVREVDTCVRFVFFALTHLLTHSVPLSLPATIVESGQISFVGVAFWFAGHAVGPGLIPHMVQ